MNRRNRTIAVLGVAIVLASIASFAVYRVIQRIPERRVEVANYKVVVAAKSLRVGERLTAEDVKLVAWPSSNPVTKGHSDVQEVIGRGLLSAVEQNEPLTETKLAPTEAGAGLSPTIPQGMRAMSVKVNEVVGVAGFVVPGTRVDVLVTLRHSDDSTTGTVARNIQVLTAGTRYDQEKAKDGKPIPSTVVTLMVTPTDAERIALAQSQGELMLALRNPLDGDVDLTPGARAANLFVQPAGEAPVKTAPPVKARSATPKIAAPPENVAPEKYLVEAIRAAKRTTEEVQPDRDGAPVKQAKEVIR